MFHDISRLVSGKSQPIELFDAVDCQSCDTSSPSSSQDYWVLRSQGRRRFSFRLLIFSRTRRPSILHAGFMLLGLGISRYRWLTPLRNCTATDDPEGILRLRRYSHVRTLISPWRASALDRRSSDACMRACTRTWCIVKMPEISAKSCHLRLKWRFARLTSENFRDHNFPCNV